MHIRKGVFIFPDFSKIDFFKSNVSFEKRGILSNLICCQLQYNFNRVIDIFVKEIIYFSFLIVKEVIICIKKRRFSYVILAN